MQLPLQRDRLECTERSVQCRGYLKWVMDESVVIVHAEDISAFTFGWDLDVIFV